MQRQARGWLALWLGRWPRAARRVQGCCDVRRAALYLRVSRGEQHTENQRPELEQLAVARGLTIVATFEEAASAAARRPELDRLVAAAHRGELDAVLVWSLDRLGRSMVGNLQAVLDLDRYGVQVVSIREPWLDTGGPVRSLLVAIFGWVAEQERLQIVARTNAGIARARRKGIRLGRPQRRIDLARAQRLRDRGLSVREIAAELGVPSSTLHRALTRPKKGSDSEGG